MSTAQTIFQSSDGGSFALQAAIAVTLRSGVAALLESS